MIPIEICCAQLDSLRKPTTQTPTLNRHLLRITEILQKIHTPRADQSENIRKPSADKIDVPEFDLFVMFVLLLLLLLLLLDSTRYPYKKPRT